MDGSPIAPPFDILTPMVDAAPGMVCGIDGVCAVPESAVPESAVPESAVPESAVRESAVPESTGPGSTAPASAGLDGLVGTREIDSAQAMEDLGRQMGGMLHAGDLVVLTGPLGAGKTTLTRGIAAGLGVRGPIQSPTFVIARTHPSLVGGAPLVHADAYRLHSAMELDDLDIDMDGSVVVVEWGHDFVAGLRESWWEVEIGREEGGASGLADSACALPGYAPEDQDHPDPRIVRIARRP